MFKVRITPAALITLAWHELMSLRTPTFHFARQSVSSAVVLLCLATLVTAGDRPASEQRTPSKTAGAAPELRREGTRFEGAGKFEISGDRVTFEPLAGGESFRVVENLALERVARVLGSNKDLREWTVAGVFLEYQGSNHLLLTRAALKQPVAKGPKRT